MVLALVAALTVFPATPYGPSDLAHWRRMLNSQCPSHHIDDWMPERNQADLIDKFETALPTEVRANIAKAVDVRRVCASAEGDEANSCEKIVDIHALRKVHLLWRFTAFACSEASCSELASCRRPRGH
jgi:hypothetical protein